MLPLELWLQIFVRLDPEDLDIVPQVCRKWRALCTEQVWRGVFEQRWGRREFTPCSTPFSWRREVVERSRSLKMWNKRQLGTTTYHSPAGDISDSCPDWDRGLLIAANRMLMRACVIDLATGSWDRTSQSYWIHTYDAQPQSISVSKYGLLQGYREGYAYYSPVGAMSQLIRFGNDEPISACCVSPVFKPSSRSNNYTLALGTSDLYLFYSAVSVPRRIPFGERIYHIQQMGNEYFVVTGMDNLWWVDSQHNVHELGSALAIDTIASAGCVLVMGPEVTRIDWATKQVEQVWDDGELAKYAFDEHILALYKHNELRVFSHRTMTLLWSATIADIDQVALNSVVLVCAGAEEFMVYNVLTGQRLAPKFAKPSARARTEIEDPEPDRVWVAPSLTPMAIVIVGRLLYVYGERLKAKPRAPPKKARARGGVEQPQISASDLEEHLDYHSRRINTRNLATAQGLTEQDQIELAKKISETTEHRLTEEEAMAVAMQESVEMSREECELDMALKLSLVDQ